jgi:hypothetical protein
MKIPAIPKSKKKQTRKLEKTVHALFDLLLDQKGWNDPQMIPTLLPEDTRRIAYRAFKREDSRIAKKQRKFWEKNYGISIDDYLDEIKQSPAS